YVYTGGARLSAGQAGVAVDPALRLAGAHPGPGRVRGSAELPDLQRRPAVPIRIDRLGHLHARQRRPVDSLRHRHRAAARAGEPRGPNSPERRTRARLGDALDTRDRPLAVDVRLRVRRRELAAHASRRRQLHPSQLVREPDPGLHRDHRHRGLGSDSLSSLDDLRGLDPGPTGAGVGGRDRRGAALAGVREDHRSDPPSRVPGRHHPFHDLGLWRVQPGLGVAQSAAEPGLLPDVGLLVPGVVPRQPVRAWLGGGGRDGRNPGGRDVCLRPADGAPHRGGGLSRRTFTRTFYDALGVLIFVVMLFPIYWMVSTALKPGKEILSLTPVWFPSPVTFDNFRTAINVPFFWNDVVNSLTVVLSVVAISIALAFLAAVSVARFGFRGRTAFVVMVIAVQMVPLTALV